MVWICRITYFASAMDQKENYLKVDEKKSCLRRKCIHTGYVHILQDIVRFGSIHCITFIIQDCIINILPFDFVWILFRVASVFGWFLHNGTRSVYHWSKIKTNHSMNNITTLHRLASENAVCFWNEYWCVTERKNTDNSWMLNE